MADVRGRRIVATAIAVGVAGSAMGSAVYVWGPMHTAYERVCDGLPFLRLIGPVPLSLLATAMLAGFIAGTLTLLQVVRDSRRITQQVDLLRVPRSERLERVAEPIGLGNRYHLIQDVGRHAFCHGLIRPTVYVTTGLLAVLNDGELRAVLAHERAHLYSRDPLRTTIGRVLSRLLLFVPLHEEAYRAYRLRRELAADRAAVESTDLLDLASALLKTLGGREPRVLFSAATVGFGDLDERINALTGVAGASGAQMPWDKGLGQAALRSGVTFVALGALFSINQEAVLGCLI